MAQPVLMRAAKRAGGANGYSFAPFLGPIAPFISTADVSICQMETPLSANNTDLSLAEGSVPSFNAPWQLAATVKNVGFDGCSTANNHTFDRKLAGLQSTRQVMERMGLKASGPSESADKPGHPVVYEANGLKIAHLSYSYTLDNRFDDKTSTPDGAPWTGSNLYAQRTANGITQDAAAARAQGADIVLVSMHWGAEYQDPTAEQREYAKKLLSSGQVDWIVGNHPHTVQTCEKINGRYVNYALGNTMSSQDPAFWLQNKGKHVDDGALAKVTFTRDAHGKITTHMTYQPIHQPWDDHVVYPTSPNSHPDAYQRVVKTMSQGCDATPLS